MSKHRKINVKSLSAIIAVVVLLILTLQIKATNQNNSIFFNSLTVRVDSPPATKLLLQKNDTSLVLNDTAKKKIADTGKVVILDTLKISKDSLDAPVKYSAEDSGVLIIDTKQFV